MWRRERCPQRRRSVVDLVCPFCGEDDFDRIGLKQHLQRGWCDAYNETPATDRPEPVKPLGAPKGEAGEMEAAKGDATPLPANPQQEKL
jgi:hypothetical protein